MKRVRAGVSIGYAEMMQILRDRDEAYLTVHMVRQLIPVLSNQLLKEFMVDTDIDVKGDSTQTRFAIDFIVGSPDAYRRAIEEARKEGFNSCQHMAPLPPVVVP